MPSIEQLMQELSPTLEAALRDNALPPADIDCDIGTYAELCCGTHFT